MRKIKEYRAKERKNRETMRRKERKVERMKYRRRLGNYDRPGRP
jgi:hypothetical protein